MVQGRWPSCCPYSPAALKCRCQEVEALSAALAIQIRRLSRQGSGTKIGYSRWPTKEIQLFSHSLDSAPGCSDFA